VGGRLRVLARGEGEGEVRRRLRRDSRSGPTPGRGYAGPPGGGVLLGGSAVATFAAFRADMVFVTPHPQCCISPSCNK
jgi:hypothetical protein